MIDIYLDLSKFTEKADELAGQRMLYTKKECHLWCWNKTFAALHKLEVGGLNTCVLRVREELAENLIKHLDKRWEELSQ